MEADSPQQLFTFLFIPQYVGPRGPNLAPHVHDLLLQIEQFGVTRLQSLFSRSAAH